MSQPPSADHLLPQPRTPDLAEVFKAFAVPRDQLACVKNFGPISQEKIDEIRATFERGLRAGQLEPFKHEGAE